MFWAFDGERWTRGSPRHYGRRPAVLTPRGPVLEYQLTLEPQRGQWVPALDLPAPVSGINNGNLRIGIADSLRSANELDERTLFTLRSWPQARIGVHTAAPRLAYARRLPATGNPRTRALAQGWLAQGLAPAAIVEQALHRFRGLPYFYTLRPQPLPETNRIDAFLFDTMQGFCAHYAGAFTFLMRAAGIPARVVTGYLGGTVGFGGYLIVRGANAHAWSEVWLAGRGWVRVDPTAAVAPQRVESGLAAALQTTGGARFLGYGGSGLWNRALLAWDWVNAGWNRWFLAYGPQLQQRFLRALGLYDLRSTLLVLTFLASGFLLLLGIFLARQTRPRRASDPVQQAWLRLCARLARAGLARAPGEGPFDYAERVAGARPDHAAEMRRLSRRYIALRYAGRKDEALHRRFLGGVRAFRPRRTCRT
ncbi:MAG: DUF3488 and transglutaminase-like domain-containing protein [Salinisphaera sp.]|nr:DUF3488 and transglutaminase-like domain-containing protein [Salinisphaera sp.]